MPNQVNEQPEMHHRFQTSASPNGPASNAETTSFVMLSDLPAVAQAADVTSSYAVFIGSFEEYNFKYCPSQPHTLSSLPPHPP